jgi:hypothetical protein
MGLSQRTLERLSPRSNECSKSTCHPQISISQTLQTRISKYPTNQYGGPKLSPRTQVGRFDIGR